MSLIADNLRRVRDRIAEAAVRSGRDPNEIELCAVSKRVEIPRVEEAMAAGVTVLGENRIQEAVAKIPQIRGYEDVEWHFIGRLQKNKARRAVEHFQVIQSVDSLGLAQKLSDLGVERGTRVRVLVEVLTSSEGTKHGLPLDGAGGALEEIEELPGLRLEGLMTMAPFTEDVATIRRSFAALRKLRTRSEWGLSMGMTGDYEWAIEEGSTLVRVGTGIFGTRG